MDYNPYLSPHESAAAAASSSPTRHSGLGIASFAISVATVLAEFILMAVAGVLEASTPGGVDENSPLTVLIGLGICGGAFVNLVGIGLGIAALFQRNRKKLFAVLGIAIGVALLLGVVLLFLIGLAVQQAGG